MTVGGAARPSLERTMLHTHHSTACKDGLPAVWRVQDGDGATLLESDRLTAVLALDANRRACGRPSVVLPVYACACKTARRPPATQG